MAGGESGSSAQPIDAQPSAEAKQQEEELQQQQQRRADEARAALTSSLSAVGSSLDTELRARASVLHANSLALNKQQVDVGKQTTALHKESDRLQKVVDNSTTKLKEIGDVQNWAELIERDLFRVEETLRIVEAQDLNGGPPDGRSSPNPNGHA
ncbi:MAG: hypothetical protein M1815_002096 [Lichina confinis]|nr:MAG: hypothetical protein M1815_002096 [Lichina confinis]